MAIIEIRDLKKVLNGNILFENVNLDLEKGKIYGFIGQNGTGKSVFFKMICGFMSANQGTIKVFDKRIGKDIDIPDNIGIIIETPGFLEDYNQLENLKYLASIRGKIGEGEIIETLERVGLDLNNKQKVKKFSLGMRQKLAIAQAVMENPKLLILDEPFNGLDQESITSIRALLLQRKEEGATILLTSHLNDDMQILCDEVYEIKNRTMMKNG